MLTPNQIIQFAKSRELTKNILTEYYQHELLQSFFQLNGSEHFSFIGGTAIRICYGGARFSEDIDFDTEKIELFDSLAEKLTEHMRQKGFELEFRLIHKGAYHCYLKFPRILKVLRLSGYDEEKLLIKMDASALPVLTTTTHLLNNYGVFQNIHVAPAATLLSKKLLTIAARRRPKGRDLYDVTYLWSFTEPDHKYLETVGQVTLADQITKLIKYVQGLDLDALARDVLPFLTNPEDAKRVQFFDRFLKSKRA
jgi:predicted nucleotidyltransferase component of viral defense system